MKPVYPRKDLIPVYTLWPRNGNGRTRTVVNYLAGTLVRAALQIVGPHAPLTGYDPTGIHPKAAQLSTAGRRETVIGQHSKKRHVLSIICQRHRYIGLAAGEGRLQHRRLK